MRFGLLMFKDFTDNKRSYLFNRIELRSNTSELIETLKNEKDLGGGSDAAAKYQPIIIGTPSLSTSDG